MKRLLAVIRKEYIHILRDPKSLAIVFIMPILMIFIYGYALTFDLNNINTAIIDFSKSNISKSLINDFRNNKYFNIFELSNEKSPILLANDLLRKGEVKEIIIIPKDFSKRINKGMIGKIGIIIDGSDSNTANIVYQYNEMIINSFLIKYQKLNDLFNIKTKVFFNPELKSANFFIPGLVAVLLLMVSALLTSISISKEKENGSLDLIFISPLKSFEIIIGKTIPYIFVSLIEAIIILLFSYFWFNIPIRGNIISLTIFTIIYIITGLSIGIFISTSAPDQRTAMMGAQLATILPSIMLSGFIFPLESLNPILKSFSYLIPATYFLRIIRGIILKGTGIENFGFEAGILILISILLLLIAMKKFNKMREIRR